MGVDIDINNIDSMKYNELRSLAKEIGIKANMKFDRLREAIKDYCMQNNSAKEEKTEEVIDDKTEEKTAEQELVVEPEPIQEKPKTRGGRRGRKPKPKAQKNAVKEKVIKPETPQQTVFGPTKSTTPFSPARPVFALTYSRSDKKKHAFNRSNLAAAKASPLASPLFRAQNKSLSVKAKTATPSQLSLTPATKNAKETPSQKNKINTPIQTRPTPQSQKRITLKANTSRSTPQPRNKSLTKADKVTQQTRKRSSVDTPTLARKSPRLSMSKATPGGQKGENSQKKTLKRKMTPSSDSQVSASASPSHQRPKRSRTGTYEIELDSVPADAKSSSPGVKEVISSLTSDMTDDQMKQTILSAIDKKVQEKVAEQPEKRQIPRFAAFVEKQKQEKLSKLSGEKTKTPDWKNIHERHFGKMDSLDEYLAKRRQRTQSITASTSKAKLTADRARANMHNVKVARSVGAKTSKPRTGLFNNTPHKGVPFVPSVTSTSKMNLNFTTLKSPNVPVTVTGKKKEKRVSQAQSKKESKENVCTEKPVNVRRSLPRDNKKKFETPSKANMTISHTPLKKFDLKASLARPVTWKPYTGKIKTQYASKPAGGADHRDVKVKTPKVQTREDRRNNHMKNRAAKKDTQQMKRRGLAV